MTVLSDHHHSMIRGERDDVDPVPRFDNIKIMFDPCSGGDSSICPYGKDTERLSRFRPDAWPWFDHFISPYSASVYVYLNEAKAIKKDFILFWMMEFVKLDELD